MNVEGNKLVKNIASFLDDHIARHGEIPSLIFKDKEYTNHWIRSRSHQLGNGLKKLGVKKGDKVAVSLENSPEVIVSFQAILRIGAIIAPIMFNLSADETEYILDNSDASVFITNQGAEDKIQKALGISAIKHIITLDDKKSPGITSFEELIENNSDQLDMVEIEEDDLALLIYTAGTTGRPKGVMLSHGSLYHQAVATYELWVTEPRRTLSCLPFAHMFGVSAMLNDNLNKDPDSIFVLMEWFDPKEIFRLIEKYKITGMGGVPTMFWFLLNDPDIEKFDLSSLDRCVVGAAPVLDELYHDFQSKLDVDLREAYGLSESCGGIACHHAGQPRKTGSAGTAIGETVIKAFNDDDNELPPGEAGEIVVSGLTLMKGYYKNPEETRKVIRNGWLHTGDVGYVDEDGYIFITDRKKDMIIKGGENIFPSEIENILHMHPSVLEAAVIGIKDPKYGEDVLAFVVKTQGSEVTEEELIAYSHEHYTKFKCPSQIRFIDNLPKSGVGKVLKRELRKLI